MTFRDSLPLCFVECGIVPVGMQISKQEVEASQRMLVDVLLTRSALVRDLPPEIDDEPDPLVQVPYDWTQSFSVSRLAFDPNVVEQHIWSALSRTRVRIRGLTEDLVRSVLAYLSLVEFASEPVVPACTSWLEMLLDFEAWRGAKLPMFAGVACVSPVRAHPELVRDDPFPMRARRFGWLIGWIGKQAYGLLSLPEPVKVCDSLVALQLPMSSGLASRFVRLGGSATVRVLRSVVAGSFERLVSQRARKRSVWVLSEPPSIPPLEFDSRGGGNRV